MIQFHFELFLSLLFAFVKCLLLTSLKATQLLSPLLYGRSKPTLQIKDAHLKRLSIQQQGGSGVRAVYLFCKTFFFNPITMRASRLSSSAEVEKKVNVSRTYRLVPMHLKVQNSAKTPCFYTNPKTSIRVFIHFLFENRTLKPTFSNWL